MANVKRFLSLFFLSSAVCCAVAQRSVQFTWGSKDVHYAQTETIDRPITTDTLITAWKGERLGALAVLRSADSLGTLRVSLTSPKMGKTLMNATVSEARFINYVLADNYQHCGYHPMHLTTYGVPDIIDQDVPHNIGANVTQPIWCTIDVPQNAQSGTYSAFLNLVDTKNNRTINQLKLNIRVLDRTLPTPKTQQFHVDFWQQPYAVSRLLNVERWSKEHEEALKPYLRLLARSGQKVVSAILFYEPWGDQSFDKFSPMVKTSKTADGKWQYDYTIFDRWVELCTECGIDKQINCFSMVPWDMSFRYTDETGREVDLKTSTNSEAYRELWTSFLQNFAKHLKDKGWYDKTCIAMDERGLESMLDAYKVAQKAVPGLKMALAGSYHPELADKLYDYCIGFGETFPDSVLSERKRKGYVSTTYTCCSNTEPNLFSNSLPAEAAYIPLWCIANHFDGYLHWSWMNWDDHSLTDSRFRLFGSGDTYLIYPGGRSSVRYERFIEGVALSEKVRIMRDTYLKQGNKQALSELNAVVAQFAPAGLPQNKKASDMVRQVQALVND